MLTDEDKKTIQAFAKFLESLDHDEDRCNAISLAQENICSYCGSKEENEKCHCWNDE